MNPTPTLLLIGFILFSCGNHKKNQNDQIVQLLTRRRKGLEENNTELYLNTISSNYNDGIDTFTTIKTKFKKFINQFSLLRIKIKKRTIYIDKNKATVVEEYRFTATLLSGKKIDVDRQAVLQMEYHQSHGWKIINGISDFSFPPKTTQSHVPS